MDIIFLKGTEDKLYRLVAPLAMNPAVLRQNRGVAFKTTEKHVWVLAIEEGQCVGFLPCVPQKGVIYINNYHVNNRNKSVFKALLKSALENFKGTPVEVITQKVDSDVLKELRFKKVFEWVNYVRYLKKNS